MTNKTHVMICRINLDRFKNFMSSLSLRDDDDLVGEEGGEYTIHYVTFSFDGSSFSGGNGIWNEVMNAMFKTEIPVSAPKKKKKDNEEVVEMGDSYNG